MFQREALNYAIASGDSLQIAMSKHNLSLEFDSFDELDSALYYEKWPSKGCLKRRIMETTIVI